ncbi:MAG: hypothetical protein FWG42_12475 [Clostridiales bacterium]|nr:hypothetical protein [Clostridiales bacterium]
MKLVKKLIAGLFVASLICLYVVIYAVPGVTDVLTQTEILQFGNLRITDDVTCYFVRDEKVYGAVRAGDIYYYVEDAVHVKKGAKILDVSFTSGGNANEESGYADIIARFGDDMTLLADFSTEFNGITSYYIDGYENYFTPGAMRGLKYDDVGRLVVLPVNVVRESTLKGEPLYKICNNREWYMVCWVNGGDVAKYGVGKDVTVELSAGEVRATIIDIVEDDDKWLIILKTNRYYEDFARVRSEPAKVVTSNYSGIIIRNESITAKDGQAGVFIRTKSGAYVFTPIKIITTDGINSLAEVSYYTEDGSKVDTVKIYDEILRNPSRGQNRR